MLFSGKLVHLGKKGLGIFRNKTHNNNFINTKRQVDGEKLTGVGIGENLPELTEVENINHPV